MKFKDLTPENYKSRKKELDQNPHDKKTYIPRQYILRNTETHETTAIYNERDLSLAQTTLNANQGGQYAVVIGPYHVSEERVVVFGSTIPNGTVELENTLDRINPKAVSDAYIRDKALEMLHGPKDKNIFSRLGHFFLKFS